MVEEEQKPTEEKKEIKEEIQEEMKKEKETEEKPEKKPEKKKEKPKKTDAVVNAKDMEVSTKVAVSICNVLRNKKPQQGIEMLEKVLKKQLAVPYKGEIPHRKKGHRMGKILGGRYPEKASKIFIKMLKNLIANASVNGFDSENLIISRAVANKASRPVKPSRIAFGRKTFKRTHILLVAKEMEIKK